MTNWYTADTHFGHESVIGFGPGASGPKGRSQNFMTFS